ncbi:hypothetical protein L486_03359 [Kwoniella mangroviensis CBS 10435]|uniref:Uncharacterized protein n=1 Tax=Kwoniella mangroviensis CBS 10435 TaxID=1331196 RepID=A0A1B9ITK2_9TREE|nr:uncharacterized protein I203_02045 [Kwoniella mangroviensis CBS 8507]OCF58868.1 hypothetical protein L486_03359 [Kwoniella mangroviensis CBS 10435]OCF68661.1 hypothetical protein I203_02045 [Kwoniella mangroviensis CBS 8507]
MMCIKHVLIYFLVLPIPAASPVFLLLFVASAFIAIKPCGYCLSLLAILFLSTSPQSPFLHPSLNSSSTSSRNSTSIYDLPLSAPSPNRTWLNLNEGRYSSPNLVGYQFMDKAITPQRSAESGISLWKRIFAWDLGHSIKPQSPLEREITGNLILDRIIQPYLRPSPSPSAAASIPAGEVEQIQWNKRELPRNYIDLSWKGIGFIVDFNMKRSNEGIEWEVEEVLGKEWVRPTREDELRKAEVVTHQEQEKEEVDKQKGNVKEDTRKIQGDKKKFWKRIPLVGSNW